MHPDRPGTLHDFRSHEIADQLTLLDAELFYKIEVKFNFIYFFKYILYFGPELIGQSHPPVCLQIPEVLLWAKEQNEEKSPNLTQFTEHFNNMSYWYEPNPQTSRRHVSPSVGDSWLPDLVLMNVGNCLLLLSYRVRSLIIQQEKAQDREKLLLKFIKIMKVSQKI